MRTRTSEIIAGDQYPRIEPGEYQAVCYKAQYGISYGGQKKLYLRFRLVEGRFEGTELFMVCCRPKDKLTPKYKLHKQWCLALGRQPSKGERFNKNIFKNRLYSVLVRDTERKHRNGRPYPDYMQYSVIDSILEAQTGVC